MINRLNWTIAIVVNCVIEIICFYFYITNCLKNKNCFIIDILIAFFICYLSVEERTTLPSENVQSDEPKSIENDGETKPEEDTTEHTEENVEKNEEKSGDQEKEE